MKNVKALLTAASILLSIALPAVAAVAAQTAAGSTPYKGTTAKSTTTRSAGTGSSTTSSDNKSPLKQPEQSTPSLPVPSEAWRKNPPNLPPPRDFKLPVVTKYKLPNGLDVQLLEDHRYPFVTVNLGLKTGSSVDPRGKEGLAGMTADMLTEGTTKKTSKQIADEVDFIGGGLKAYSDLDFTLVSSSALSKYTNRLFECFAEIVLDPVFPQSELDLKKTNLKQELAMKRSTPDFLLEERFNKVVFGDHPYSVVAPTPESIDKIARQDLEDFKNTHYLPNESVLIVVGDFDQAKMKGLIESKFGSWKAGTMPATTMSKPPAQQGKKIYLVDRPGSVQSSIKLGNVAINKKDPDYFPMMVANQILGGGAQARLFVNIREQKGYTYGAYSSVGARKQPGPFAAEGEVRTEVTSPSLQEFLYELDRLRNVKATEKELKDAKSYLAGSFQLGLETQAGLAQRLLEVSLHDLPPDYLESYSNKIMAVSLDDIRKAARKHIDLNNIVITVVGDANKIKEELELFAPVELYDITGKLSQDGKPAANSSKM